MFILANFLRGLGAVLNAVLTFYMFIMIGRVIISWVNADPYNPIVRFLYNATEPVLYRLRRRLPVTAGGIDFSPMIVLFLIYFLQLFLVESLFDLARTLRPAPFYP